ncbi:MAG TPA: hypothetical protein VLV50_08700 [Stellaceae bacterium]|nr:hypothetical protein [Stellaceae bacterium]
MRYLVLVMLLALAACQNSAPYDSGCAGNPELVGCAPNTGGGGAGGM